VAHSGPLRRAQVSFAAMWAGESAFMVALGVVAFRDGGVGAVGLVTGAQMALAALLASCSPRAARTPSLPPVRPRRSWPAWSSSRFSTTRRRERRPPPRAETAAGGAAREILQGFTTIAGDRGLSLITGLGLVQTFTRGCLTVLVVVVAIDP
jgi:hypothetical protein